MTVTNDEAVESAAQLVFAKVAKGHTLCMKLCQDVVARQGSSARPSVVLYRAVSLLSDAAAAARYATR